jgi:hypothetical protein
VRSLAPSKGTPWGTRSITLACTTCLRTSYAVVQLSMIVPAWLRNVGTELGAAFGKKVAVCAKKATVLGFLLLLFRFLENNFVTIAGQKLPNLVALLCFLVILLIVSYNLLMHDRFGHSNNGSTRIIIVCVSTMLMAMVVEQSGPEGAANLMRSLFEGFSWMVCSIIEVSFKSFSDAFWPLGPVLAALIVFLFGFYRWATLQERVVNSLRAMPDADIAERRRIEAAH